MAISRFHELILVILLAFFQKNSQFGLYRPHKARLPLTQSPPPPTLSMAVPWNCSLPCDWLLALIR